MDEICQTREPGQECGGLNKAELAGQVLEGLQTLAHSPLATGSQSDGDPLGVFGLSITVLSQKMLESVPGIQETTLKHITEKSQVQVSKTVDGRVLLCGCFGDLVEAERHLKQKLNADNKATATRSSPRRRKEKAADIDSSADAQSLRSKRKLKSLTEVLPKGKQRKEDLTGKAVQQASLVTVKVENDVQIPGQNTPRRTSSRSRPKISYAALACGRRQSETEGLEEKRPDTPNQHPVSSQLVLGIKTEPELDINLHETSHQPTATDREYPGLPVDQSENTDEIKLPEAEADDGSERLEPSQPDHGVEPTTQEVNAPEMKKRRVGRPRKTSLQGQACPQCCFRSSTASGLRTHIQMHHSTKTHTCDVCFVKFPFPYVLRKHRKVHFLEDGSLTEVAVALCRNNLQKMDMSEKDLSVEVLELLAAHDQREKAGKEEQKEGEGGMAESVSGGEPSVGSVVDDGGDRQQESQEEPSAVEGKEEASECIEFDDKTGILSTKPQQKKFGEFECPHCGMILTTERYLQYHISAIHKNKDRSSGRARSFRHQTGTLATEENRHKCPHCDFVCYRTQTFTRHVQGHNKPALFKCDLCSYTNPTKGEVNRHKRNAHADKKFACEHCPTKFRNRILLRQHMKQKHLKMYQTMCEHCGKEMSAGAYKAHCRRFHGPESDANRGVYVCTRCGKTCRSRETFTQHLKQQHPDEDDQEEAEVTKALLVEDGPRSKKTCGCKLCGFRAHYPRAVVNHIIKVHAERRHICSRCGAAFPRQALLQRHTQVFHEGLERCQCGECGRYFRSQHHLKGHIKRMHMAEFHSKCEVCGKGFYHRNALLQHMELHKPVEEREYPFHCEICSKRFRFKSAFNKHMAEHQGNRPHVCLVCKKTFTLASSLEQHLYVHTEERPYVCSRCGKAFKMKKYLDVHMLSHTAQNIVCQHCGRMFLKKEALQRHICHCVVISDEGKLEPRPSPLDLEEVTTETGSGEGTTSNMYVCTSCGEVFADMTAVPDHVCQAAGVDITPTEDEGAEGNKFICMACGAQFEEEASAHQHVCEVLTVQQESSLEDEGIQTATHEEINMAATVTHDGAATGEIFTGHDTTTIILEQPTEDVATEVGHLVADISTTVSDVQHGDTKEECLGQTQDGSQLEVGTAMIVTQPLGNKADPSVEEDVKQEQVLLVSDGKDMPENVNIGHEGIPAQSPLDAPSCQAMQIFLCGICRKMFTSQDDINLHLLEHEQDQTNAVVATATDDDAGSILETSVSGQGSEIMGSTEGLGVGGQSSEETQVMTQQDSNIEVQQEWTQSYIYGQGM